MMIAKDHALYYLRFCLPLGIASGRPFSPDVAFRATMRPLQRDADSVPGLEENK